MTDRRSFFGALAGLFAGFGFGRRTPSQKTADEIRLPILKAPQFWYSMRSIWFEGSDGNVGMETRLLISAYSMSKEENPIPDIGQGFCKKKHNVTQKPFFDGDRFMHTSTYVKREQRDDFPTFTKFTNSS